MKEPFTLSPKRVLGIPKKRGYVLGALALFLEQGQ